MHKAKEIKESIQFDTLRGACKTVRPIACHSKCNKTFFFPIYLTIASKYSLVGAPSATARLLCGDDKGVATTI